MEHYAGIDVSLELSSVCVVDGRGKIVKEAKVASEPEALVCFFKELGFPVNRIGFEAGPRIMRFSKLKRWGMDVAKRRGSKRAKVALARKIGVILHRMWIDGTTYRWAEAKPIAAQG